MKNNDTINTIIIKALSDETLSTDERDLLDSWLRDAENQQLFDDFKNEDFIKRQFLLANHDVDEEVFRQQLWEKVNSRARVISFSNRGWYRYVAAAAIVFLVAITAFWLFRKPGAKTAPPQTMVKVTNDVAPGKTKAVLTLADGSKIVLDSAANGKLAQQGVAVVVNNNGQLIYNNNGSTQSENLFNTLSTNKGEIYATTLSDGSKIWLNAGSSIRYPVVFTGKERRVTITGEAYFEVAHNPEKPFIVTVNDMQVQVMGTHFNVNSYSDEDLIKTTLLEGLVKVSVNGQTKLLQPGQQAQVSHEKQIALVKEADVDEVMAWKNGRFYFEHADISMIMRQLERWYDITVVYEGKKPTQTFGGEMQRSLNLSQTLRILEGSGLHFRIDGRKLIVTQ